MIYGSDQCEDDDDDDYNHEDHYGDADDYDLKSSHESLLSST